MTIAEEIQAVVVEQARTHHLDLSTNQGHSIAFAQARRVRPELFSRRAMLQEEPEQAKTVSAAAPALIGANNTAQQQPALIKAVSNINSSLKLSF